MEDTVNQNIPTVNELQAHFLPKPVPPPPQNIDFHELAVQQISQVGSALDPAQTQLATVMATLQIKSEHEAKLERHLLYKTLLDTASTVSANKQDILQVKDTLVKTEREC